MNAFLIFGAESSGTKLAASLLIQAGCAGSDKEGQPFDRGLPNPLQPIVWRRSVPSGKHWPDLVGMITQARETGYTVQAVVMVRDWLPSAQSQIQRAYVEDEAHAYGNLRRAYPYIFRILMQAQVPYELVTYEGLIARPALVADWLLERLGLPSVNPDWVERLVRDEDMKWWKVDEGQTRMLR